MALLENELSLLKSGTFPVEDISSEITALNKNLVEFTITNSIVSDINKNRADTLVFAYAKFKFKQSSMELKKLKTWLSKRIKSDKLKLVVQ